MTAKMAGKMAKQLAGSGTGQSLMDRVTQAKYSLAGSALGKIVAKASTEELIAPKKKHLENLTRLSNEPNVSIPLLVNFLSERTHEKSWVVVFKALITTHHLLNYGNEKVSQYIASNNCRFHLPHFNDKSSSQSYEMSLFIRKYSKYLSEKTRSYQTMAFDFCKVKRGKDDGVMRTMPADKLLKALPVLRDQLYVLFEFEATEKDLNNLIINAAFILLYKDLIRLFASYNEGMMNLVEKYFTMKRSHCKTAIELYRDFPNVMTKVDEFLTVAESLGIGDKESIGLHPVPPQILEAMEQHLALLKKNKKAGGKEDDSEDMDVSTTAAKSPKTTTKSSSPAPRKKVTSSPARPKSPARPPSPLRVANHNTAEPPLKDSLLIADLDDTPAPNEAKKPANLKVPPAEVIVTDPDGERTEPLEDAEEAVLGEAPQPEEEADECTRPVAKEEEENEEEDEEEEGETHGLSPDQQQAVIAAATSHFALSADRTIQAVKQSATLTPRQTRKSRNESEEPHRSASPSRPRSPSPARPPPPGSASTSQTAAAASRSGCSSPARDSSEAEAEPEVEKSVHFGANHDIVTFYAFHHHLHALSTKDDRVSDAEETADSVGQPEAQTALGTAEVPIDDLLGFDDLGAANSTGPAVQPVAAAPPPANAPATQAKSHTALEDLLCLDPLLGSEADFAAPAPAPTPTPASTPAQKPENVGLPPGLKPAPTDVVIRPAVVDKEAHRKKENPLDQLDTTLASLASSLGGSSSNWGSASTRKK